MALLGDVGLRISSGAVFDYYGLLNIFVTAQGEWPEIGAIPVSAC